MNNPFKVIETRLSSIENLILDLKHLPIQVKPTELPESPILIKEASEFLGITTPTMYGKVHKKEIPHSKRGNRLYFFKSELIEYLKKGRSRSNAEIEAEAVEYLAKSKRIRP